MAKIKHTKNEMKGQRDALRRFERYLPTLQLKKQQLQLEVRRLESAIGEKRSERKGAEALLAPWIKLFSDPFAPPSWRLDVVAGEEGEQVMAFGFGEHLRVREVVTSVGNVAGVNIPILEEVVFEKTVPDLFATPTWLDDGLEMLEKMIRLRAELDILEQQHQLLREELRTTTQRVNLFEKVKIPECRENIRVIRIFLGDEQTAAVARAKIAKSRSVEKVRAA